MLMYQQTATHPADIHGLRAMTKYSNELSDNDEASTQYSRCTTLHGNYIEVTGKRTLVLGVGDNFCAIFFFLAGKECVETT